MVGKKLLNKLVMTELHREGKCHRIMKVIFCWTHQTIPWAPEPIGLRFWYLFKIVNFVSPTSTVYNVCRALILQSRALYPVLKLCQLWGFSLFPPLLHVMFRRCSSITIWIGTVFSNIYTSIFSLSLYLFYIRFPFFISIFYYLTNWLSFFISFHSGTLLLIFLLFAVLYSNKSRQLFFLF